MEKLNEINEYFVLTNKRFQKIVVTKDYMECYNFLMKYKNSQIRKLDYTGMTRLLNKNTFLIRFFEITKDQVLFFNLVDNTRKGNTNQIATLREAGFSMEEFREYKRITENLI